MKVVKLTKLEPEDSSGYNLKGYNEKSKCLIKDKLKKLTFS